MTIVRRPPPLDLAPYESNAPEVEPFYGLPRQIAFCSRCTYSNQKPNSEREFRHARDTRKPTVAFDAAGVCRACRVAEEKERTDWAARRRALAALCDRYRRPDGRYDVLVPGSGGKDSFFASWVLKHEFGMHPLTLTWAPHLYTDWGRHNHQSWIDAGFDNLLFLPNSLVQRLLTRLALERLFHPFQPFMMGQMYYPPKVAAELDIPLVFYGENPAEYGNAGPGNAATKDLAFVCADDSREIFIGGTSLRELQEDFGLTPADLRPYLPGHLDTLKEKGVDIQYLGYYIKWHPQQCYYYAVEHGGFSASPERSLGTYSKYSSIDDKIDDFHYYTTFIKFGIGRATYDSAQEIRNGDITREEGVALVGRYDGEYPHRFEQDVFDYLSLTPQSHPLAAGRFEQPVMDRDYFEALTDSFRSPHLWHRRDGRWVLRHSLA